VRQPLRPSRRNEAAIGDFIDVIGERERDHVRGQPVDHGSRLLARAAVGLLDLDGLAGGCGEFLCERLVDVGVELAGRIVGDVEQRHVGRGRSADHGETEQCAERGFRRTGFDH
jgi:hypothetical protein